MDLVTFTEEIFNEKPHFLCGGYGTFIKVEVKSSDHTSDTRIFL